jgi:hypothetical protein
MGMNPQLRQALRAHNGRLTKTQQLLVCSDEGDLFAHELDKFNQRKPCWMPPTKSAKTSALEAHSIVAVIMACVAMNIATPAVTVCNTTDCFTDSSLFYLDRNFIHWSTKRFPTTEGGQTKVLKLARDGMKFKHMAQAVLNDTSDDLTIHSKKLIEAGKTYNPKQVEDLILRSHKGNKSVSLLDNGFSNLFFIHDDKGNVFVLDVHLDGNSWDINIFKLDSDGYEWNVGTHLFLRN